MRVSVVIAGCCVVIWSAGVFAQPESANRSAALLNQYALAEQAFRRGDFSTAQMIFDAIVHQANDQPLAQFRLGMIYQMQHRFRQAMAAYDEVLLLPPGDLRDDPVRTAQMKARFNRAVLSLQAAAEDLEHIEPNSLDAAVDKGRMELQGYVQAALAVVGEQSKGFGDKASEAGATGVVLERSPPVSSATTAKADAIPPSAVETRTPAPVLIRGGMNPVAVPKRFDERVDIPH